MRSENFRVLAVDDEPRYLRTLKKFLEAAEFDVYTARDGKSAVEQAALLRPDIILLELKLSILDGYEVCRQVREFSDAPIIIVTALTGSPHRINGLECGADDYVTKPFNAEELLARIRAILRRAGKRNGGPLKEVFQLDGLVVDFGQQTVKVDGVEVLLTPTEYRLLVEMIQHPNRVLVPSFLLEKVWGAGYEGDTSLVWQAVHRLRRKIEPDRLHPRYIRTRPGLGYIFVVPFDSKEATYKNSNPSAGLSPL